MDSKRVFHKDLLFFPAATRFWSGELHSLGNVASATRRVQPQKATWADRARMTQAGKRSVHRLGTTLDAGEPHESIASNNQMQTNACNQGILLMV